MYGKHFERERERERERGGEREGEGMAKLASGQLDD